MGSKKRIELEDILNIKNSFFLKFKNFDDERDVSVLIGRNVFIDKTDFDKIASDVFISQNLIGCKVYKGQDFIGIVSDYFETPANPVIEIGSENRNNFLIPYVHSIFEKIDTENKILILNSDFGIDDDKDWYYFSSAGTSFKSA